MSGCCDFGSSFGCLLGNFWSLGFCSDLVHPRSLAARRKMMVGRWCFPLGKVTFQERTVKLQVGRFSFFLNDEIFPHHFFDLFLGLATSKKIAHNSRILNLALFGLDKSKVLKWFKVGMFQVIWLSLRFLRPKFQKTCTNENSWCYPKTESCWPSHRWMMGFFFAPWYLWIPK